MSVKNRLKEFIKREGITIAEFEKSINAANGYVNSISKGIGQDKMLLILEKYPNMDAQWLLYGGESINIKGNRNIANTGHIGGNIINEPQRGYGYQNEIERLKEIIREKDEEINKLNNQLLESKDEIINILKKQYK